MDIALLKIHVNLLGTYSSMRSSSVFAAAILLSGACFGSVQASPTGLVGDTLQAGLFNQSTTEPLRLIGPLVQEVVSSDGTAFPGFSYGEMNLNMTDSEIILNNFYTSDRFTLASFSGVIITDLTKTFATVSLDAATNMLGLTSSNIKIEGNTLSVNLAGFSFTPSTQVILNVTTAPAVSAVPEPETCSLLLAGLGLIGFMGRRKARASA
jgi:hypothetical protein